QIPVPNQVYVADVPHIVEQGHFNIVKGAGRIEFIFFDGADGNILGKDTGHAPGDNGVPDDQGNQAWKVDQLYRGIVPGVPDQGAEMLAVLDLGVDVGFGVQYTLDRRIVFGNILHNTQDAPRGDHSHILSDPLFFPFVNGQVVPRGGDTVLDQAGTGHLELDQAGVQGRDTVPRSIEQGQAQPLVLLHQFTVLLPQAKVRGQMGAPTVDIAGNPLGGIEKPGLVVGMGIDGHHQRNEHKKAIEKGISVPEDKVDDALHAIVSLRRFTRPPGFGKHPEWATLLRCSYSVPSA